MEDKLVFTPSAVLALLSEIEELKDRQIVMRETETGVEFEIDDSQYTIDSTEAAEVALEDNAYETVVDADEAGVDQLAEDPDIYVEVGEPVEGGIIKELAKTLLIGGLVRLTAKELKK